MRAQAQRQLLIADALATERVSIHCCPADLDQAAWQPVVPGPDTVPNISSTLSHFLAGRLIWNALLTLFILGEGYFDGILAAVQRSDFKVMCQP